MGVFCCLLVLFGEVLWGFFWFFFCGCRYGFFVVLCWWVLGVFSCFLKGLHCVPVLTRRMLQTIKFLNCAAQFKHILLHVISAHLQVTRTDVMYYLAQCPLKLAVRTFPLTLESFAQGY